MGVACRLDNLAAQRLAAGWEVDDLARAANVSDWLVRQLEQGGVCEQSEAQRIMDALGVSAVTMGKADL